MLATHVTINNQYTYRLGQTSSRDSKIACIGKDGLVHRVCYWRTGGIPDGTRLHTSGEDLHYHMGQELIDRIR